MKPKYIIIIILAIVAIMLFLPLKKVVKTKNNLTGAEEFERVSLAGYWFVGNKGIDLTDNQI